MRSIPLQTINQGTGQESRYQLNSPLLFAALSALNPESRVDILDLKPAVPEHLEYFADFHCKLVLPGCDNQLLREWDEEMLDAQELSALFEKYITLPTGRQKPLDAIFLWDLPNYLDRDVLSGLVQYLLPWTDSGSVIHTYIHTRQTIPASPASFRLQRDNRVRVEINTDWTGKSPMYYQELLHKVFKPFRVERGMLLANGMQEYILRIKY
ncbi:MAG: hypothetical protein P8Z67_13065 [Gammaproteobacteria bacterium]